MPTHADSQDFFLNSKFVHKQTPWGEDRQVELFGVLHEAGRNTASAVGGHECLRYNPSRSNSKKIGNE
jgi:hypothetical protein